MADWSPARITAPLALLAVSVGIAVVIASSGSGTPAPARTSRPASHRAPHRAARPRTVVVRAGDTLSAIASRTGVTLDALQRLNPGVDPQALHAGQRLKLAP
jgi:LysM repeat protein